VNVFYFDSVAVAVAVVAAVGGTARRMQVGYYWR